MMRVSYLGLCIKKARSCYLAAARSLDKALTGFGSEIVMRVPQTEQ
jgi:hypothetical protein